MASGGLAEMPDNGAPNGALIVNDKGAKSHVTSLLSAK